MLKLTGDEYRAGVLLLAGSEQSAMEVTAGFSLHEELTQLVRAGLSPLAALQTATLNPARFLGREQDLGTVEKGKLADLVLLSADPLVDIRNTSKIDAVFVNGTYLSKDALQSLLSSAAAAAGSSY